MPPTIAYGGRIIGMKTRWRQYENSLYAAHIRIDREEIPVDNQYVGAPSLTIGETRPKPRVAGVADRLDARRSHRPMDESIAKTKCGGSATSTINAIVRG